MLITWSKCITVAVLVAVLNTACASSKAAQPAQIDPLSVYVSAHWPDNVKTIGQAANYVLESTGYRISLGQDRPDEAMAILSEPMPQIAKLQRTMPVVDVLQMLIGDRRMVIVDHRNRLVSFAEVVR